MISRDFTTEVQAAACSEESWIGGTSEWCDGWFVHRDYVYDDYGAELGLISPHGSGFAAATGDVDHRDHGQALNSAELLVLRLRAEGDDILAFGDEPNRILISTLGRGPTNQYVDWGARDVLDVLDVLAGIKGTYRIDQDAVFVSGYSMKGQGTLQLATWFPDRFAGGMRWVGPTGDCLNGTPLAQGRQWGLAGLEPVHPYFSNSSEEGSGCNFATRRNTLDFLENTRHVPIAHLYADRRAHYRAAPPRQRTMPVRAPLTAPAAR
ncbi:MAG: hypothetical protein ACT4NY_03840 [Pseudonocardiales bacterium]